MFLEIIHEQEDIKLDRRVNHQKGVNPSPTPNENLLLRTLARRNTSGKAERGQKKNGKKGWQEKGITPEVDGVWERLRVW